jgi:hypothetical protein
VLLLLLLLPLTDKGEVQRVEEQYLQAAADAAEESARSQCEIADKL